MKAERDLMSLPRSTSYRHNRRVLPSSSHHHHHTRSSITFEDFSNIPLRCPASPCSPALSFPRPTERSSSSAAAAAGFSSLLRSLLTAVSVPATRWLGLPATTNQLGRKVTGTLFGHRRGHVTFAVQDEPRSEPSLLLELATSTSALVKEMASGLVRIALECDKSQAVAVAAARGRGRKPKLFHEPMWTMYCNGRKCGYALTRACGDFEWHVLRTVQSVSVGAGVIPSDEAADKGGRAGGEGEVLYMRARFERVVGSRDSEAFYMMNPDGNGGPELSIFLLRV